MQGRNEYRFDSDLDNIKYWPLIQMPADGQLWLFMDADFVRIFVDGELNYDA